MRQLVTFRACNRVAFGITAALFVVLMGYPAAVFALFAIEDAASAAFIARRAAVVFLGLATLLWMGQNAPPHGARSRAGSP